MPKSRCNTQKSHDFKAKIGFEKYAPSPKLLRKNCPKSAFQTKPSKFDTFSPISWDSVHIFQNRWKPWKSVPWQTAHGKSVPRQTLTGQTLPGQTLYGQILPGQALHGQTVPGQTVPGQILPG